MTPLDPAEEALVAGLARLTVERRLAVPAVLLLESSKPLSFLASQALHFAELPLRALVDLPRLRTAARLLEDRDKLEQLLRRIEALEAERLARGRA